MSVKSKLIREYDKYDSELDWDGYTSTQINDYLSLAILFHDSVYNVWEGSPSNERNSGILLFNYINDLQQNGWTDADISNVGRMIWCTANHNLDNTPSTFLEKLMLDIDISNFAESLDVCKYNQHQIFLEFKPRFPDKDKFLEGNVSFLQSLLDRPTLYYTPMFADKENKARENILAMIKGDN